MKTMKVVAAVVQTIAEIKGISPHGENAEELGQKAMQEGTRAKVDDESMEDYLNYLRNEVQLDKEKMLNLSDEDRLKSSVIGTCMLSEAVCEKTNVAISPDFLLEMQKMSMSGEKLARYIDSFSDNSIDSLDSLTKYLRGELDESDATEVGEIVEEIEQEFNPECSLGEVLLKIEEMKENL